MFIQGIGLAAPPYQYTQRQCWEALCESPFLSELSGRSRAILRKVLTSDNGIETRHFAMADLKEAFSIDPNTLHARFARNAPVIAADAARAALENAEVLPSEIEGLVISTCTGYLCPGLTSYVSELLGLNPRIFLSDMVGQGCGAALPNLRAGEALLKSGQAKKVLSICVEVCSAAFYLDNDPGVLISACLFGDGAAAAVLGDAPARNTRPVEWKRYATVLNPKDRELLRFENRNGMLRNVLDKSVPLLVVEHVRDTLAQLLDSDSLNDGDIAGWILHSGGRDVLAALQSAFNLPADALQWSTEVLRRYGNISSPSVLFALHRALNAHCPGGTWFMSAFGAGITCHGALLHVD